MEAMAIPPNTLERGRILVGLAEEWIHRLLRHHVPRAASGMLTATVFLGLGALVVLPLLEAGFRRTLDYSPVNSGPWVQHLTLWVGLLGAVLASAGGRHFTIALREALPSAGAKQALELVTRAGAMGILAALAYASWMLVWGLRGFSSEIGDFLPVSAAMSPLPLAFAAMAFLALFRPRESWGRRVAIAAAASLAGPLIPLLPMGGGSVLPAVGIGALVLLALAGVPLFAVLGGAALLLFFAAGEPSASVVDAAYQIVTKPTLPSVPLFALAGVVLARGGGPKRLVRFVTAWIGWMRGGASMATILGCAFLPPSPGPRE